MSIVATVAHLSYCWALVEQLTAESPYTLRWQLVSQKKLLLPMRDLDPHLIYDSIRTHNPNGTSISSAVFAQMTVECPYTLQWDAPSPPQKIALPTGDLDSGPHLIHGSLFPPESSTKTASRSVQPFFSSVTDRPTDRPTTLPRR